MTTLSAAQVKDLLLYTADEVIAAKPLLTEIDSAIGDGDHGIGMEKGMRKAREKLAAVEPNDVYALFRLTGKTMLMSMGGASGVIFGSMFLAGARGQEPAEELSTEELAAMFRRALGEIRQRGGAAVGDKTMVDAFQPAVESLERHAAEGFATALEAAEQAAKDGLERTKSFEAKFGRAKNQSSTIGYPDAGAASVWIIFRAMREYLHSM